jgi:hypothetical protein
MTDTAESSAGATGGWRLRIDAADVGAATLTRMSASLCGVLLLSHTGGEPCAASSARSPSNGSRVSAELSRWWMRTSYYRLLSAGTQGLARPAVIAAPDVTGSAETIATATAPGVTVVPPQWHVRYGRGIVLPPYLLCSS